MTDRSLNPGNDDRGESVPVDRADIERLLHAMRNLRPVPGESEYVVRSASLPDRRLSAEDARLWKRVMASAHVSESERDILRRIGVVDVRHA